MSAPQEILPGLEHWTEVHPNIKQPVCSYRLVEANVLLDPLLAEDAEVPGRPGDVLLSNRHHWRSCGRLVSEFGTTVHVPRAGLHEFGEDRPVTPYDPGDELPGGAVAHEVGVLCPDEMALELPAQRALAIADGAVRFPPDGPLAFVPDFLLGDEPEAVRAGLRDVYARLAEELDFDHLLLAHGNPVLGDGRAALARFAAEGESISF